MNTIILAQSKLAARPLFQGGGGLNLRKRLSLFSTFTMTCMVEKVNMLVQKLTYYNFTIQSSFISTHVCFLFYTVL